MSASLPVAATILNVDDNEGSLYVKTRVLRKAGFQVIEADRGSSVIPLLVTHQPDLVLLDVNLGDANGYDICRAIKADPNHASTIVVQISASFVDSADRIRGIESGADSYFTEPMEPEELVANVSALLRMRQMEQDLRRSAVEWQKTFEAVHDGVAIVQETGIISRCNPAFEKLTGGVPCVGRRIDEVLNAPVDRVRAMIAESSRTAERSSVEIESGDRAFRLSIDPVLDPAGQVTHFACVLSDVTAEREIANLNEQLRTTVADLQRAKERADSASRAKDDFLAVVSHELRTPMTSVIGWTQMLQMFARSPETTMQAADAILSAAKAQSQLVDDLLDVSRITTGKLRLELAPMDLAEVVEETVQTVLPAATAKKIRIETKIASANVAGDRSRLQQVAWNLLSNAMKFTPVGGLIEVKLETSRSRVILTVTDTGQGIAPEFLSAVFDRFSQADSGSNRSGTGLGLGLAIVRHIVELHGGEVTAASGGAGTGATFTVSLPLAS